VLNRQQFKTLLQRILEHNQPVLALLGTLPEPFRDTPPRHIRAWLYDYRFTYKREQDPVKITEDTPLDHIGKTWYRNRVTLYAKASKKQE